jgi:hypothetical protein
VVKGPVDDEDKDIPDGFKKYTQEGGARRLQAAAGNAAKKELSISALSG